MVRTDRTSKAVDQSEGTAAVSGFSVADVGRMLRRARTRQGLSLRDVSARTGVPESLLRAAETGQLADREGLSTLKTVRRYADFLGLPGDRFALAILEDWPTRAGHPRGLRAVPEGPARLETGPTAAFPAFVDSGAPPFDDVPPAGGDMRTPPAGGDMRTTEVPRLDVWAATSAGGGGDVTAPTSAVSRIEPPAWGSDGTTTWTGGTFSDTGMAPAVRARSTQIVRRRRHVPAVLQAAIVLVSLAVIAGAAILAVDRLHPSWLQRIGLTKATTGRPTPGVSSHPTTAAGGTIAASSGTGAPASATASHASERSSARLRMNKTSATAAAVDAGAPAFVATVRAVGGPCWIDVTPATSSSPTYEGVLRAGTEKSFRSTATLVVELGATTGRLSVSSSAGQLPPTAPATAPYRVTVRPSH